MNIKTIQGRKYDITKESVLSYRNKSFYGDFKEFHYAFSIKEFIDYLMSGIILDREWNSCSGYGSLEYVNSLGENKILGGNHGVTNILRDIEIGKFDPSEVLHDFVTCYRGMSINGSTKEERQKFYNDTKNLIENGFSITMVDHNIK